MSIYIYICQQSQLKHNYEISHSLISMAQFVQKRPYSWEIELFDNTQWPTHQMAHSSPNLYVYHIIITLKWFFIMVCDVLCKWKFTCWNQRMSNDANERLAVFSVATMLRKRPHHHKWICISGQTCDKRREINTTRSWKMWTKSYESPKTTKKKRKLMQAEENKNRFNTQPQKRYYILIRILWRTMGYKREIEPKTNMLRNAYTKYTVYT